MDATEEVIVDKQQYSLNLSPEDLLVSHYKWQ